MERWSVLDETGRDTGKTILRGEPLSPGSYHLVVDVWIQNKKGAFLISRRVPEKEYAPCKWAPTAGCAVAGDDSLKTALKETREELGLALDPAKGRLFRRLVLHDTILDVWFFRQEADLSEIIFQPGETDAARWAEPDEICQMLERGAFLWRDRLPYLEDLFTEADIQE